MYMFIKWKGNFVKLLWPCIETNPMFLYKHLFVYAWDSYLALNVQSNDSPLPNYTLAGICGEVK